MAVPTPAGRATLDFLAAQANARRRTAWLVISFTLAVAAVIAIVYAALVAVAGVAAPGVMVAGVALGEPVSLGRPDLLAAAAVGVLAVTGVGTAFHAVRLSAGGGEAVAAMLGGVPVDRGAQDPALRRLVNVAEEMAIAAGLPVPRLYVLEGEPAINAFAAGYTPGHAVVAVTRGALDRLTRDELQGVVAHELSHVLNADTRIDLQLLAAVGGLSFLALIGRLVLENTRWSRSRSRDDAGGAIAIVGLALLVAGALGAFCGKLVRFAVARQREWLADASAVQFTRNPDGLAGALRRIAAEGSEVLSPHAPEAAHLFFASAATGFLTGLFSTHPPIEERIRRIAPHAAALAGPRPAASPAAPAPSAPRPQPPIPAPALAPPPPAAPARAAAAPLRLPPPDATAGARALVALPASLAAAAREPFGARALACALLVGDEPAVRQAQLAYLGRNDPPLLAEVARLAPSLAGLARPDRLALLALSLPALDALSPRQGTALRADLQALSSSHSAITPFELAVRRIVARRLERDAGAPPRTALRSLDEAAPEGLALLSALAWIGGRDAAAAQAALDAGVTALGVPGPWRLLPRDRTSLAQLDLILTRLDGAAPAVKARLLAACAATALADGRVTPEEAELVRAVSAALGLPAPPLLGQ
ncbi:MAG TPA: M48 family metallopeptidase [Anaeromyxobacter sp.]|nr:M48 family metallopeptidase [Anaeromyxobacter sp.]